MFIDREIGWLGASLDPGPQDATSYPVFVHGLVPFPTTLQATDFLTMKISQHQWTYINAIEKESELDLIYFTIFDI